jgi:hypothetical protein
MVLSFSRLAAAAAGTFAMALAAVPADAGASELATAQGTIAISDARPGLRAPACSELVVEARDALDNHLIADTQPAADETGACRYAVSVPAQSAVWLRVQPVLVAGTRVVGRTMTTSEGTGRPRASSGSVALRFTVIAPATYFFAPNERKTISLSY